MSAPAEVIAAVERGRSVIPCGANKRPLVKWKRCQTEPASREQAEQWAADLQPACWAVATGPVSGVVVLDFDGELGRQAMQAYELAPSVETPSGGAHVYVEYPGHPVRTVNGKADHDLGRSMPNLDVRGDGGYAIFCGRNGAGDYRLIDPAALPLERLPVELRPLLGLDAGSPPTPDKLLSWALAQATPGGRNAIGFKLACQLRDNGHDRATAEQTLAEYAARAGRDGDHEYSAAEAAASVEQAYSHPAREPWSASTSRKVVATAQKYEVTFTDDKTPKLVLPVVPEHDDLPGLLAWLTTVLALDPAHPVTDVRHEGQRGPDGHVHITRAGAGSIRFEPARAISTARQMLPALIFQRHPSDGEPYGFRDQDCRTIAHVITKACGVCAAPDEAQEAAAIVGTFTFRAEPVEGFTTYGTTAQRYEAAEELRSGFDAYEDRRGGHSRYLVDDHTGEIVIRVSDLQVAAREHTGSSVRHGWLDARIDHLGWARVRLEGRALPGREGRTGPHLRCDVYRGHLPSDDADEGSVTT